MKVEIVFGAMAPKLSTQIKGLPKLFDRLADAVILLSVQGILTDAEKVRAERRIIREIVRWDKKKAGA